MRNLFCHWNRIGLKEEKVKLSEYKESEHIFIDANIFIDYSLPNPKYGKAVADFLEKLELLEVKAVTSPVVLDEVLFVSHNMGA